MPQLAKSARKPRRRQDKLAGSETDPEPKVPSKQTRARAKEPMTEEGPTSVGTRGDVSPWESSVKDELGSGASGRKVSPIRKDAGRVSDASFTSDEAAKVFDSDQYQCESEGSDCTSPDVAPIDADASSPVFSILLARLRQMEENPPLQSSGSGYGYG